MKDNRKSFENVVLKGSNVWFIDAEYNPGRDELQVYRVRGDITDMRALSFALSNWMQSKGFGGATVKFS